MLKVFKCFSEIHILAKYKIKMNKNRKIGHEFSIKLQFPDHIKMIKVKMFHKNLSDHKKKTERNKKKNERKWWRMSLLLL